jgi:hypothetical protein
MNPVGGQEPCVERGRIDRPVVGLKRVEERCEFAGRGDPVAGPADRWQREVDGWVDGDFAAAVGAAEDRAQGTSSTGCRLSGPRRYVPDVVATSVGPVAVAVITAAAAIVERARDTRELRSKETSLRLAASTAAIPAATPTRCPS